MQMHCAGKNLHFYLHIQETSGRILVPFILRILKKYLYSMYFGWMDDLYFTRLKLRHPNELFDERLFFRNVIDDVKWYLVINVWKRNLDPSLCQTWNFVSIFIVLLNKIRENEYSALSSNDWKKLWLHDGVQWIANSNLNTLSLFIPIRLKPDQLQIW